MILFRLVLLAPLLLLGLAQAQTPPPAPVLSSPKDDSLHTPDIISLSCAGDPSLTYHVQLSTDQSFGSVVADSGLAGGATVTWNTPLLDSGTVYYWRFRAKNAGGAGDWSVTRKFTVVPPLPRAPTLKSPLFGFRDIVLNPTLTWLTSRYAASYRVVLDDDSTFASPLISQAGLTDTVLPTGTLERATKYFWRVGSNNFTGAGPWSPTYNFTTVLQPPAAPTQTAPLNQAANVPIPAGLAVTGAAGSVVYDYQLSADSTLSNLVVDDSLRPAVLNVSGLTRATRYHWRARARNAGGIGPWSGIWSFTTLPHPPAAPALLSPADNAANLPVAVTLVCSKVSGADGYIFKTSRVVMENGNPTYTMVDSASGSDTTRQVSGLVPGAQYQWVAVAVNMGGQTSGDSRRFTVDNPVSLLLAPRIAPKTLRPEALGLLPVGPDFYDLKGRRQGPSPLP